MSASGTRSTIPAPLTTLGASQAAACGGALRRFQLPAHKFVKHLRCRTHPSRATLLFALESNCDVGYVPQGTCEPRTSTYEWHEEIIRSNGGYSAVGRAGDGWDSGGNWSVG